MLLSFVCSCTPLWFSLGYIYSYNKFCPSVFLLALVILLLSCLLLFTVEVVRVGAVSAHSFLTICLTSALAKSLICLEWMITAHRDHWQKVTFCLSVSVFRKEHSKGEDWGSYEIKTIGKIATTTNIFWLSTSVWFWGQLTLNWREFWEKVEHHLCTDDTFFLFKMH